MPAPTLVRTATAPLLLGALLWRCVAALLYACSLLLIPHNLPAAVFALLAALVCFPGVRAALRDSTGLHVRGTAAASGAVFLLLCAAVSTGYQADVTISSMGATGAVVASASPAGKP